jgi:hypothetical protein
MVPWYTVEPPTNGLCPKHCMCVENILHHDVWDSLESYYKNHVVRITEQLQRTIASKEHLLDYAASTYWEGKAHELKIRPHLLDLSAPLPPCVIHIVERQIEGMLEDFVDLEEWFFAFQTAPEHRKKTFFKVMKTDLTLPPSRKDVKIAPLSLPSVNHMLFQRIHFQFLAHPVRN